VLNVTIMWPNLNLCEGEGVPLVVKINCTIKVVDSVEGYAPAASIPPSPIWLC